MQTNQTSLTATAPTTAAKTLTEAEITIAGIKFQARMDARFVHLARKAEFEKLQSRNPKSKSLLRFPEFLA